MSLYGNYIREKTNDSIIEDERAFATYRYINEKTVYIVDIFVLPMFRKTNIASTIADNIVEEARKKGCNKLLGSVVPSNKWSTVSLKILLAYGMTLESSSNDFILFKKDI
jgi:predicted GNAT family acetyltransferase